MHFREIEQFFGLVLRRHPNPARRGLVPRIVHVDGFDGEWVVHHRIDRIKKRGDVLSTLRAGGRHFPHHAGNVRLQHSLELILSGPQAAENVTRSLSVALNHVNLAHRGIQHNTPLGYFHKALLPYGSKSLG